MSKLITVFGSPGSGKTVTAFAIASRLAMKKKNVILLSSDKVIPQLPVLLPGVETNKSHSMGSLLLQSELTQALVTPKLVFHPDSNYFACMGLALGDTPISYPPLFDPEKVRALFRILLGLADYVIIDGMSNPVTDSITLTALEVSEHVICTITPDRKGEEFIRSVLAMLRDEKYKVNEHIRVLSPARDIQPVKQMKSKIEDIRWVLPYAVEVEERFLSGKLMCDFNRRYGLMFEHRVDKILEGIC